MPPLANLARSTFGSALRRISRRCRIAGLSPTLPPGATESTAGFCTVCGFVTRFDSWEPIDTECKRNTFVCRCCGSVARNRHLARTILDLFPTSPRSRSLADLARRSRIDILHTCASGAVHEALRAAPGYRVSEFYDDVPSGEFRNGIQCQDLERTTFADATFDLVITEDVFEHVADPARASAEIRRILKPGGVHVSTIAVLWHLPESMQRAVVRDGKIEHLQPPVYHGDPNRPDGALVFVDFGADVVERYLSRTGETSVLWSNGVTEDERRFAIYNNMVFVSRVPTR
jgi:SAM-dependent methyltransferase